MMRVNGLDVWGDDGWIECLSEITNLMISIDLKCKRINPVRILAKQKSSTAKYGYESVSNEWISKVVA